MPAGNAAWTSPAGLFGRGGAGQSAVTAARATASVCGAWRWATPSLPSRRKYRRNGGGGRRRGRRRRPPGGGRAGCGGGRALRGRGRGGGLAAAGGRRRRRSARRQSAPGRRRPRAGRAPGGRSRGRRGGSWHHLCGSQAGLTLRCAATGPSCRSAAARRPRGSRPAHAPGGTLRDAAGPAQVRLPRHRGGRSCPPIPNRSRYYRKQVELFVLVRKMKLWPSRRGILHGIKEFEERGSYAVVVTHCNKHMVVHDSKTSRAARWLRNKWYAEACPKCRIPEWKLQKKRGHTLQARLRLAPARGLRSARPAGAGAVTRQRAHVLAAADVCSRALAWARARPRPCRRCAPDSRLEDPSLVAAPASARVRAQRWSRKASIRGRGRVPAATCTLKPGPTRGRRRKKRRCGGSSSYRGTYSSRAPRSGGTQRPDRPRAATSGSRSTMGLAPRPGTAVLPACSTHTSSGAAARSLAASAAASSGQRASYSTMTMAAGAASRHSRRQLSGRNCTLCGASSTLSRRGQHGRLVVGQAAAHGQVVGGVVAAEQAVADVGGGEDARAARPACPCESGKHHLARGHLAVHGGARREHEVSMPMTRGRWRSAPRPVARRVLAPTRHAREPQDGRDGELQARLCGARAALDLLGHGDALVDIGQR